MTNRVYVGKAKILCNICQKHIYADVYDCHVLNHQPQLKNVMGVNKDIDDELTSKQEKYENSLDVECSICGLHMKRVEYRKHLYEHGLNNFKIDEMRIFEKSRVICPICFKANNRPLKGHLRRDHCVKLHTVAKGIYDTITTINKREKEQQIKNKELEKKNFRKRFVQGGLPSLGKKTRWCICV